VRLVCKFKVLQVYHISVEFVVWHSKPQIILEYIPFVHSAKDIKALAITQIISLLPPNKPILHYNVLAVLKVGVEVKVPHRTNLVQLPLIYYPRVFFAIEVVLVNALRSEDTAVNCHSNFKPSFRVEIKQVEVVHYTLSLRIDPAHN
jgi:hypothetical protein